MPAGFPADDVAHFHGKPIARSGEQLFPRSLPFCSILRVHIRAACEFVERTGKRAAIGALGQIEAIVDGSAGTHVVAAGSST